MIKRDGGCVFQGINIKRMVVPTSDDIHAGYVVPPCNGYAKDGHLILQADHLITRGNAATYADTRLIVCVCKGHHGWKKWNEARYNEIVRALISEERVKLWDKAYAARFQPHRKYTYDWKIELAALKQELHQLNQRSIATAATL